jgi:hypothetical protein
LRRAELPRHDRENPSPEARVTASRALLQGIVDYAGLFPPAGLSMQRAVANYAEYAGGPHAWMLGRFVLPASRLSEFTDAWSALPAEARRDPFELSLLLGADLEGDVQRAREFMDRDPEIALVSGLELKATTSSEIRAAGRVVDELPEVMEVFLEIPVLGAKTLARDIAAIGLCAKIRTGGVTAQAFPSSLQVVSFMRACVAARVPFKATAGLHHPITADYRLTYDDDPPRARMFGFLNLLLGAALVAQDENDRTVMHALEETDADAFSFGESSIAWREFNLDAEQLGEMRHGVVFSFGSCSFTEPVEELSSMGVLA